MIFRNLLLPTYLALLLQAGWQYAISRRLPASSSPKRGGKGGEVRSLPITRQQQQQQKNSTTSTTSNLWSIFSGESFPKIDGIAEGFLKMRVGSLQRHSKNQFHEDAFDAVWHYTGLMRNPLNGAAVVGVEGLEFVRRLSAAEMLKIASYEEEQRQQQHTRRRKRNGQQLPSPSLSPAAVRRAKEAARRPAPAFVSRKVFIYTDVNKRNEVITKFRSGKHAPLRDMNPIKETNEIISINSLEDDGKPTSGHKRSGKGNKHLLGAGGKPYQADVMWPSGRHLTTDKISITRKTDGAFSLLDILGNLGSIKELGVQYNVVNFMRGKPKKPMNRWVSFQSQAASESSGRSQEYYTITKDRVEIPSMFRVLSDFQFELADSLSDMAENALGKMGFRRLDAAWTADGRPAELIHLNPSLGEEKMSAITRALKKNERRRIERLARLRPKPRDDDPTPVENEDETGEGFVRSLSEYISPLQVRPPRRGLAVLKYTRYGEAPPWYSIGRSVAMEISATKYKRLIDVPVYARRLVADHCPSFFGRKQAEGVDDFMALNKDPLDEYKPWYDKVADVLSKI